MKYIKQEKDWGRKADKFDENTRHLRKTGNPPKADKGNLSLNDLEYFAKNAGFKPEENNLIGNKVKAVYYKGRK